MTTAQLNTPATLSGEYDIPDFFEIADRFIELYVSYRQRYVMMINGSIFVPKGKDSQPLPLTNSVVCKHLHKKFAIGVFAGAYSSKFVCFDVDDGDRETVRKIISLSAEFGVPKEYIYVSTSGGKGFHVEIFFDSLVYTEKLLIFYDSIIIKGRLNPQKVEFRPSHTQAIKLPLSRHAKTGNVCWYLNADTFEPYTYDAYVLEIKQFDAKRFNELVDRCGLRKSVTAGPEDSVVAEHDPDAPELRHFLPQELALLSSTHVYPDITEQGQRHILTRAIAIHNRKNGMTMEDSRSALEKWWAAQDKEISSTPDSEALEDIRSLVEWTFSDSFIVPAKVKKMEITKDMLRVALAMDTKTAKKLMFLIACYCSVYGRMNMSYNRMAEYLKCSAISVRKLIARLAEEGWIKSVTSRTMYNDGKFMRKPNTYYIAKEAFEGTKDLGVEFCFDDPLIYEAKELPQEDETGRIKTVIPELEPEGFHDFYYHTILQTVSSNSVKDFLTRGEIDALRDREII